MDLSSLALPWPGEPAAIVSAWRDGEWRTLASCGDLSEVRAWASVTKLVSALAVAIDVDQGRASLDNPLGPPGSTLAHLLSHSSGLGLEEGDRVHAPGLRRIYSNYGIDLAAERLARTDVASWLEERVTAPLSMNTTRLVGRASEGLIGSTQDLGTLACQWARPTLISTQRRDDAVSPFLPGLDGVVPGFGRFTPCPWGLGVEIRGDKQHWMGDWPRASFGHFGRSGALALVDVAAALCLVATSTVDFGPWARELWPTWTSNVRAMARAS